MKTIHHTFILIMAISSSFAFAQDLDVKNQLNDIATNAFRILRDVPLSGLEKSSNELHEIVEDHKRLALEADVAKRHLSVVLADAVAFAIVTEIYRSETVGSGHGERSKEPAVIPFNRKAVLALWENNMPDFPNAIEKIIDEPGTITGFVKNHSSVNDVLEGRMIDKTPLGTIRPRIRSLMNRAHCVPGFGYGPSPDEQLVFMLAKYQAFIDIGIVLKLYGNGNLPCEDVAKFKIAAAEVMDLHGRRVDDGMKVSPFKVWMTFREYHPKGNGHGHMSSFEGYCLRLALALSPFITDTGVLPEYARRILTELAETDGTDSHGDVKPSQSP